MSVRRASPARRCRARAGARTIRCSRRRQPHIHGPAICRQSAPPVNSIQRQRDGTHRPARAGPRGGGQPQGIRADAARFGRRGGRAGRVRGMAALVEPTEFGSLRWDGALGEWTAAACLGNRYARGTAAGILHLEGIDRTTHVARRAGAARGTPDRCPRRRQWVGKEMTASPAGCRRSGGDLAGVSGRIAFDVDARDWYRRVRTRSATGVGGSGCRNHGRARRSLWHGADVQRIDPRLKLRFGSGRHAAIRYATGIYHQAPAPPYYDSVRGADSARADARRPLRRGYETGREAEGFFLRAEGYVKRYRDLPVEDERSGIQSRGLRLVEGHRPVRAVAVEPPSTFARSRAGFGPRRRWTPVRTAQSIRAAGRSLGGPTSRSPGRRSSSPPCRSAAASRSRLRRGGSARPAAYAHRGGDRGGHGIAPIFGADQLRAYCRATSGFDRRELVVPAGAGSVVLFARSTTRSGGVNFFDYGYSPDYRSRRPVVPTSHGRSTSASTFRR